MDSDVTVQDVEEVSGVIPAFKRMQLTLEASATGDSQAVTRIDMLLTSLAPDSSTGRVRNGNDLSAEKLAMEQRMWEQLVGSLAMQTELETLTVRFVSGAFNPKVFPPDYDGTYNRRFSYSTERLAQVLEAVKGLPKLTYLSITNYAALFSGGDIVRLDLIDIHDELAKVMALPHLTHLRLELAGDWTKRMPMLLEPAPRARLKVLEVKLYNRRLRRLHTVPPYGAGDSVPHWVTGLGSLRTLDYSPPGRRYIAIPRPYPYNNLDSTIVIMLSPDIAKMDSLEYLVGDMACYPPNIGSMSRIRRLPALMAMGLEAIPPGMALLDSLRIFEAWYINDTLDLSPLSALPSLGRMWLDFHQDCTLEAFVASLSQLRPSPSMDTLEISFSGPDKVAKLPLKHLRKLRLKRLYLRGLNEGYEPQIAQIRKKLKHTEVIFNYYTP
jgi:hypothetical protein